MRPAARLLLISAAVVSGLAVGDLACPLLGIPAQWSAMAPVAVAVVCINVVFALSGGRP